MIVPLPNATRESCGGKGGALGALRRAGLPVPDGFVVPFDAYRGAVRGLDLASSGGEAEIDAARRAIVAQPLASDLHDALAHELARLGDRPVAVRSSAANEDTADASAAGQHESILAARGVERVGRAIRACWASLYSSRAVAYRGGGDERSGAPEMAVLIQRLVDAEVSGVLFTPGASGGSTHIEAAWGLGPGVVGGTVAPDAYRVRGDGSVSRMIGEKRTRLDRHGAEIVTHDVPPAERRRATLDDGAAAGLARIGRKISAALGGPQDIEWAIADGRTWILQSRPVTVAPPLPPSASGASIGSSGALTGTPGSHGIATATARIVRGPADFARVHPGDIIVCPYTDPAWTPLLGMAAAVITETGGVLCHAAIVAREHGVPAVLGIPNATARIHDDAVVTVDGTAGIVSTTAT